MKQWLCPVLFVSYSGKVSTIESSHLFLFLNWRMMMIVVVINSGTSRRPDLMWTPLQKPDFLFYTNDSCRRPSDSSFRWCCHHWFWYFGVRSPPSQHLFSSCRATCTCQGLHYCQGHRLLPTQILAMFLVQFMILVVFYLRWKTN